MMDLFEEDSRRVKLFEDSVMRFKKASRNLQYLYNLQRANVKFHGGNFREELEPILSLIETFKSVARDLYHLRKISSLDHVKKAIDKFIDRYITSSLSDEDIKDIYKGHQLIRGMLVAIYNDIDVAIRLFEASKMRSDEYLNGLKEINRIIKEDYAVFA